MVYLVCIMQLLGHGVSYTVFFEKEPKQYLTCKDCVSNVEGCTKKYRRPYFIVIKIRNKHCSITVKSILIKKKSNYSILTIIIYTGYRETGMFRGFYSYTDSSLKSDRQSHVNELE